MRQRFPGIFVILLSLFLASCGSDEGFTIQDPPTGYIRVLNAITDAPALTVVIDNRAEATVPFGQITAFLNILPTIPRSVELIYADNGRVVTLLERRVTVDVDHDTALVLTGTLDNPQVFEIENLPLNFTDTDTTADYQFVHASTQYTQPVSFLLVRDGDFTNAVNMTLNQFEPSQMQRLDSAGTYEILALTQLPNSGSVPDDANVLWRSGNFTVEAKARRMFPLLDYLGPGGKGLRVMNNGEAGQTFFANENLPSAIRLVNALPDHAAVDLWVKGEKIISNQAFATISDYVLSDSRGPFLEVKITPAGDADTTIFSSNSPILQGSFQTIVVSGTEAAANLNYVSAEDRVQLPKDQHLISGINAAPSVASVDLYLVATGTSIDSVSADVSPVPFLGIAGPVVDPGTYDLVVTEFGTKTVLNTPVTVTIEDGKRYRFYITEYPTGSAASPPLQVILADDFLPAP